MTATETTGTPGTGFRSFAEQTIHYFDRPHVGLPDAPVGGPAAWTSEVLAAAVEAHDPLTAHRFSTTEIEELAAAARTVIDAHQNMGALTTSDAPLPTVGPKLRALAQEIHSGRGVVLLRGLPVHDWDRTTTATIYWILALHLGWPGAQNSQGDLLGNVTDTGDDQTDPMVRLYLTASEIAFHCDAADIVGLLCLQPAAEGGHSRIASSVAVHDELQRVAPHLAARLFEPFDLDTRGDGSALRHFPIPPCRFDGTRLRTFFHSDYFRSVTRHDDIAPIDDLGLDALDAFEGIANDPAFRYDMELPSGDLQLISNHTVVHARTGYVDDPRAPRHLLRVWLSAGTMGQNGHRMPSSGDETVTQTTARTSRP